MQADTELFRKLNAPYYVYAPPYRETSGGIRAMHYLCHALNLIGEEAYVITDTTHPGLRTPSLTAQVRQLHEEARREAIVVYPEVIEDNPLNARNVVRYLLNVPGLLNQRPLQWLTTDLIYALVAELIPSGTDTPLLEMPLVNMSIYNRDGVDDSRRRGSLVFIHRYLSRGGELQPDTADALEISFRVPTRTPQELAKLYRNAEVLYTYEHSTACYEAMLCGCPVIYLPNPVLLPETPTGYLGREGWAWGNTPEQVAFAKSTVHQVLDNYHAIQTEFWKQLRSFVEHTQAHAAEADERPDGQFLYTSTTPLPDAINAYNAGNIDYATRLLTGLLESGSEDPLVYAYLAFVCAHQNLRDDADNFIRHALSLAPGQTKLLAALGEAFLKAGAPADARKYLTEAIQLQPDLFAAYPALGEAMRQGGDSDSAIQLLSAAVHLPGAGQDAIFASLSELLAARGDISSLAELCLRRTGDASACTLGIALLARTGASPERLAIELDRYGEQFLPPLSLASPPAAEHRQDCLTIAFLISDFQREAQTGRLESLLMHLPGERYRTVIIDNDLSASKAAETDMQRAYLVSDHWVPIREMDDLAATQALSGYGIDVLVDTDGLAARNRLALFFSLPAAFKASWSDLPVAAGELPLIAGAADLEAVRTWPANALAIALPGIGRTWSFPDMNVLPRCDGDGLRFACLTPAVRVGRDSWELFADTLRMAPNSRLTINLGDLASDAESFILGIFSSRDVAADRLHFIHAASTEELCRAWNRVDIGLAPIGDAGNRVLAACLWMNRPYVALDAGSPWSSPPAALLRSVGQAGWIANSRENYIEKALGGHNQPGATSLRDALRADMPKPEEIAAAFDEGLSRALQEAHR